MAHTSRRTQRTATSWSPTASGKESVLRYLFNLGYLLLILLFSPGLLYAAVRYGKYRQGYAQKLLGLVPRPHPAATCIWMHAVSVGEVKLLGTLLPRLAAQLPGFQFVISTTTRTGYELAMNSYEDCLVCYCPLDFSWAVRTAVRRLRPAMLVLAELELWPNLIAAVSASGAQVAIVNGRLSERSFRGYRRLGTVPRHVLRRVSLIAAQEATYAQRFIALGAPPDVVHVTGSLKFDGARTDRGNPRTRALAALWGLDSDDIVFLAGSTQQPEEELALHAFSELAPFYPRLRLILVPRHPERFPRIAQLLDEHQVCWQKRSELGRNPSIAGARILLVDTVGELEAWWGTADLAYVGGSMGTRGGQNMIEPAGYGAAVSFGPNTGNFRDIVASLLAAEAAVVVHDGAELIGFVRRCLDHPNYRQELGDRARRLVQQSAGAAEKTVELLLAVLANTSPTEYVGRRRDVPTRSRSLQNPAISRET